MKLIKIMYYVNFILLIMQTVINYFYNNNLMLLGIMLLAYLVQIVSVYSDEKRKGALIDLKKSIRK